MKKFISFVLAFVMIIGTVASAAPGDIIHTELGKIYRANNDEDQKQLVKDALNKDIDNNYFFKEVENKKFVNILDEEKKQLDFLNTKIKDLGDDFDKTNPEAINKLILDHINALENIMTGEELKVLSELDTSITEENYFGDSKLPKLVLGENYSNPVPGSADNTTQIINLTLPRGSSSWVYKLGIEEDFVDLQVDEVVTDTTEYRSGRNITVTEGQYLFLGAVDGAGKLKAYASIKIEDSMIRKPKVELEDEDVNISAEIKKSENYSGATTVEITSLPGEGTWKLAILNDRPETVYKHINHNNFNGVEYDEDDIEHIVASDSELDKGLDEFKKYLIVYSAIDGEIDKYRIFNLDVNNVSGIFKAAKLIEGSGEPVDYNYSTPVPGSSAGTTKIVTLKLPTGASKWMYAIVDSGVEPNRDRVYKDSKPYNQGEDIEVKPEDNLMILATDDAGKVRAYGIVEKVKADMIKNPLATELRETTHYTKPVKGSTVGHTKFGFLKYDGIDSWAYEISENDMDSPELDATISGSSLALTGNIPDEISIESDHSKLKSDNFGRYMMIYGLDSDSKIKVFKKFIMDDTNVRMPSSTILTQSTHYSEPIKGSSPNTTKITTLTHTGLGSTKYRYKVVEGGSIVEIEFNEIIDGSKDFTTTTNIPTTVGKDLLILATDKDNKTKGYKIVPLEFDNVLAGSATPLQPTTNYLGPVPGDDNNTTKFTFLSPTDSMYYAISDSKFGTIESGTSITVGTETDSYTKATINTDISATAGQYLLLVSVDSSNKIIGAREFPLDENHIKGGEAKELDGQAYSFAMGDNPSTTKLKLEALGLDSPGSIVWRYKLVDSEPTDHKEKPYFNQVFNDSNSTRYNVNFSTKIGPDIKVTKVDDNYGWILILATDGDGRTKGYKYVNIDLENVKEHAPEIETSPGVKLKYTDGTAVDSINFHSLPELTNGDSYKYLISNTSPTTPAKGDNLPSGIVEYDKGSDSKYPDIVIPLGKYLTLYKVNKDNKILAYKTFVIDKVKQGKAELSNDTILEGQIRSGGSSFTVTLKEDTTWADLSIKANRDKLFNGFKADNEASEWSKVVSSLISDGLGSISLNTNNTELTIMIPETLTYDISEEQKVTLIVPPEAIKGAINPINATGNLTIKPTIGATISGDVVNSIVRQSDIETGGKTIIIELTDGVWATDVSGIINQFSSSAGEGSNWEKIVEAFDTVPKNGDIRRNSGSKVTITLPKVSESQLKFNGKSEVISLEIKADETNKLIENATENVVASPDFTLYPNRIHVEGVAVTDKDTITLEAPDYRVIAKDKDTWTIKVTRGSLKDKIDIKDLVITGLPRGLTANVSQGESDNGKKDLIEINLTGTASSTLANDTTVKVKIKGSAVTEHNSIDSEDIELKLVRGASNKELLEKVKINVVGEKLLNTTFNDTSKMKYSLNSTNGTTNGNWYNADDGTDTDVSLTGGFKAGRVYVRDKNNPRVFHLVATLSHPKAPTGVNVSNVDYTEANTMKVTLDLPTGIDYDYSLDGGKDWIKNYVTSDTIPLEKGLDLRIRYRATEDSLESLATSTINILDLSEVNIDVAKGVITGTTNTMEYSLSGGIEGTFSTARATETPVEFKNGSKVVVRQRSMVGNQRSIGEEIKPVPRPTGVTFNISDGDTGTITANNPNIQYRIGTEPWKDLSPDKNPVIFKPGKLEVRAKGTTTQLPSEPVKLQDIKDPASAPELRIDDFKKTIEYRDGDDWKNLNENSLLEFQVNNGEWQIGDKWDKSLLTNTTDNVGVRYKATEDTLPGLIKVVNFTGNLTFENVELNVAEGKIEGTTTAMQYSTNSTDGKDGAWTDAKAGSTAVTFAEGMKVYIREKAKPLNFESLTEDTEGIKIGVAITPNNVDYHILGEWISNEDSRTIQYRIGNDSWKVIQGTSGSEPFKLSGVDFKPGKLEFRAMATKTTLPSPIITKDTIPAKASAPQLKYDDVKHKIIDLDSSLHQYNINGGNWIDASTNTEFNGGNVVLVRLKATDKTLPSQEQKITFTKNLDLNGVLLNAGESRLENTSTLMEYSLDSTNGENGQWLPCTGSSTKVGLKKGDKVYIREKAKPRHFREVTETELEKKEFTNTFVETNLDYNILKRTISVENNSDDIQSIVNDLQYRIGTGNWINIDYVTAGDNETVLAYNVDFAPGNLQFRLRGDGSTLSSDPVLKDTIKSPSSAPNVTKEFDIDNYRNIVTGDIDDIEYRFDSSSPWIDGKHLDDEDLVSTVYIRNRASKNKLPSLIKELDFKPVLNLKIVNYSDHVTPLELNGTTTEMEYMINGSNKWFSCENGNTKLQRMTSTTNNPVYLNDSILVEKIDIRDKNQHANTVTITP